MHLLQGFHRTKAALRARYLHRLNNRKVLHRRTERLFQEAVLRVPDRKLFQEYYAQYPFRRIPESVPAANEIPLKSRKLLPA